MQFLVLFSRNPSKADMPVPPELREAEFEKVRHLYQQGLVRDIWFRGDMPGACMIVEASSASETEERLGALPLLRAGILAPPIIVLLKPYAGFGPRS